MTKELVSDDIHWVVSLALALSPVASHEDQWTLNECCNLSIHTGSLTRTCQSAATSGYEFFPRGQPSEICSFLRALFKNTLLQPFECQIQHRTKHDSKNECDIELHYLTGIQGLFITIKTPQERTSRPENTGILTWARIWCTDAGQDFVHYNPNQVLFSTKASIYKR